MLAIITTRTSSSSSSHSTLKHSPTMLVTVLLSLFSVLSLAPTYAHAASHTIVFESNCASSVMQLPNRGNYGPGTYTFDGDVAGGIASAGPSHCDINGVPCIAIEFTLNEKYSTGDVTLIEPHKFTADARFEMTPGGSSAQCGSQNCGTKNAFYHPEDYSAQRYESSPNAGIKITFTCGGQVGAEQSGTVANSTATATTASDAATASTASSATKHSDTASGRASLLPSAHSAARKCNHKRRSNMVKKRASEKLAS